LYAFWSKNIWSADILVDTRMAVVNVTVGLFGKSLFTFQPNVSWPNVSWPNVRWPNVSCTNVSWTNVSWTNGFR
jgi:hypothetical protein